VSQLEIIDDGTSTATSTASKDRKMSAREKTIDDEKRNRLEVLYDYSINFCIVFSVSY
jgi:hypothetical protein